MHYQNGKELIEDILNFLRRYKWVFALALVVGMAHAYWESSKGNQRYKTEAIIASVDLQEKALAQFYSRLSVLIQQGDLEQISRQLGVKEEQAASLLSLRPLPYQTKAESRFTGGTVHIKVFYSAWDEQLFRAIENYPNKTLSDGNSGCSTLQHFIPSEHNLIRASSAFQFYIVLYLVLALLISTLGQTGKRLFGK